MASGSGSAKPNSRSSMRGSVWASERRVGQGGDELLDRLRHPPRAIEDGAEDRRPTRDGRSLAALARREHGLTGLGEPPRARAIGIRASGGELVHAARDAHREGEPFTGAERGRRAPHEEVAEALRADRQRDVVTVRTSDDVQRTEDVSARTAAPTRPVVRRGAPHRREGRCRAPGRSRGRPATASRQAPPRCGGSGRGSRGWIRSAPAECRNRADRAAAAVRHQRTGPRCRSLGRNGRSRPKGILESCPPAPTRPRSDRTSSVSWAPFTRTRRRRTGGSPGCSRESWCSASAPAWPWAC